MSLLLAAGHTRLDVEHPVGDDLQREVWRVGRRVADVDRQMSRAGRISANRHGAASVAADELHRASRLVRPHDLLVGIVVVVHSNEVVKANFGIRHNRNITILAYTAALHLCIHLHALEH